jgi:branched-chain amino acid transport system ATP-binding protein
MDTLLQVTDLNKNFGGIKATNDLNLSVCCGQIHAVIGPNGAGKTTLISQLSGRLKPSSGRIEFEGRNITHYTTARRARMGLARSFQITSVVLPMTLLENTMLAVQGRQGHSFRFWSPVNSDRKMREEAMHSLAEVGLEDRASQPAGAVSHGEQRQLEVAMALAMQPKLLLLDEPMAGMGGEESARMVTILNRLKGDKTILLIEHDMDAVFSLADQLSVLVNGHIIATDTVQEIRNNPEVQRAYLGEQDELGEHSA